MKSKGSNGFAREEHPKAPAHEKLSSNPGIVIPNNIQAQSGRALASSIAAQNMHASLKQQKLYASQQSAHYNNSSLNFPERDYNNMIDSSFNSQLSGNVNRSQEKGLQKIGWKIDNHQGMAIMMGNSHFRPNQNIPDSIENQRKCHIPGDTQVKQKMNKIPQQDIHAGSSKHFVQGEEEKHYLSSSNNSHGQLCGSRSSGRSQSSSSRSSGQLQQNQEYIKKQNTQTMQKANNNNNDDNNKSLSKISSQDKSQSPLRFQGRVKQIKRIGGVLKVVKKSLTPKKKQIASKSKDVHSPTKQQNKQKRDSLLDQGKAKIQRNSFMSNNSQNNNSMSGNSKELELKQEKYNKKKVYDSNQQQQCLFTNKVIQDAQICQTTMQILPGGKHQGDRYSEMKDHQAKEEVTDVNRRRSTSQNSHDAACFSFRGKSPQSTKEKLHKSAKKKQLNRSITPERMMMSGTVLNKTDNVQETTQLGGGHGQQRGIDALEHQKRNKSRSKSRQRASSSQDGRSNSASKIPMNGGHQQQQKPIGEIRKVKAEFVVAVRSKSQQGGKREREEVQQLVVASFKAKQKEEGLKKQSDEETQLKRIAKKKELSQKNQDIRLMNAPGKQQQQLHLDNKLLSSSQSSQIPQFPWGVDQQRVSRSRKDQSNNLNRDKSRNDGNHLNNSKGIIPHHNSRERSSGGIVCRDKENNSYGFAREAAAGSGSPRKGSREAMGLQFLNGLTQDQIKRLIAKQKVRVLDAASGSALEKENKRESNAEEQQQQLYMQLQKRLKKMQLGEEDKDRKKKRSSGNINNVNDNSFQDGQKHPKQRSKSSQRQRSSEQITTSDNNNTHNRSLNYQEHHVSYPSNKPKGGDSQNKPYDEYSKIHGDAENFESIHRQYRELMQMELNQGYGQSKVGKGQTAVQGKAQQQQEQQQQQLMGRTAATFARSTGTSFYKTNYSNPLDKTQNILLDRSCGELLQDPSRENHNRSSNSRNSKKKQQHSEHHHGDSIDELEERKRQLRVQYSQLADKFKKPRAAANPTATLKHEQDNHKNKDIIISNSSQQLNLSSMNQALEEFTEGGSIAIPVSSASSNNNNNGTRRRSSSNHQSVNTPLTHSSLGFARPHSKLSDTNNSKQQQYQQQKESNVSYSSKKKKHSKEGSSSSKKKKQNKQKQQHNLSKKNVEGDCQVRAMNDYEIDEGIIQQQLQHDSFMEYLYHHNLTAEQLSVMTAEQFTHLRLLWLQDQQAEQMELHDATMPINENGSHTAANDVGDEENDSVKQIENQQGYYYDMNDRNDDYQLSTEGQNHDGYQQGYDQEQQSKDEHHSQGEKDNSSSQSNGSNHALISDEPFEIEELDASNYSERQYFGSKSMIEGNNRKKDTNKRSTQNLPADDGKLAAAQAKNNLNNNQETRDNRSDRAEIDNLMDGGCQEEKEEAESMCEMRRIEKEYQLQLLEKSSSLLQSRSIKSSQKHSKSSQAQSSSSYNAGDNQSREENSEECLGKNHHEKQEEQEEEEDELERKNNAALVILRWFRNLKTATLLQENYQKYFQCEYEEGQNYDANEEMLLDQLNKGMQVMTTDQNNQEDDDNEGEAEEEDNYDDYDDDDTVRARQNSKNDCADTATLQHLEHHFNMLSYPPSEIKQNNKRNSLGMDVKQFTNSSSKKQSVCDSSESNLEGEVKEQGNSQGKQQRDNEEVFLGDDKLENITDKEKTFEEVVDSSSLSINSSSKFGFSKIINQNRHSSDANERQDNSKEIMQLENEEELMEMQDGSGIEAVNHENNNDDLDTGTYRVEFNDAEENQENEEGEGSLHLHNDKYNTEVKQPDMNGTEIWRDSAASSVASQQKQQAQQQGQEMGLQMMNSNGERNSQNKKIIQEGSNGSVNQSKKNEELMEILNRQQVLSMDSFKNTKDNQNGNNAKPQQIMKGKKNLNLVIKPDDEEEQGQYIGAQLQQQSSQTQQQQQQKQANQASQQQSNEEDCGNLISELGIMEEWKSEHSKGNNHQQPLTNNSSNQHKGQQQQGKDLTSSYSSENIYNYNNRLYETDVQALAGTMAMMMGDSRQSSTQFQRQDWPMPVSTFDASKLSSLIIGGQMKYQMSEDDDDEGENKLALKESEQVQQQQHPGEKSSQDRKLRKKQIDNSSSEQLREKLNGEINQMIADEDDEEEDYDGDDVSHRSSQEVKEAIFYQNQQLLKAKNNDQPSQLQKQKQKDMDDSDDDDSSLSQAKLKKRNRQRRPSRSQDWSDSELSSQSNKSSCSDVMRSSKQSLSSTQKGLLKQAYESEISKIKQEEALKWNEMISILHSLQNQGALPKEAADQLNKLTEQHLLGEAKYQQDKNPLLSQLPISSSNSNKKQKSKHERKDSPFQFDLQISSEKKYNNYINGSISANGQQQSYSARMSSGSAQRKKDLQIEVVDKLSSESYGNNKQKQNIVEEQDNTGDHSYGSNNDRRSYVGSRQSQDNDKNNNMTAQEVKLTRNNKNNRKNNSNPLGLEDIDYQPPSPCSSLSSSVESSSMLSESYHSSLSKSIFEVDSFADHHHQHYDSKRITHLLLHQENLDRICQDRQDALHTREQAQKNQLETMLRGQRISPKSFQHKQQELEKWVTQEQLSIQRTQKRMQKTILSTEETIKKTQRDIEFARLRDSNAPMMSSEGGNQHHHQHHHGHNSSNSYVGNHHHHNRVGYASGFNKSIVNSNSSREHTEVEEEGDYHEGVDTSERKHGLSNSEKSIRGTKQVADQQHDRHNQGNKDKDSDPSCTKKEEVALNGLKIQEIRSDEQDKLIHQQQIIPQSQVSNDACQSLEMNNNSSNSNSARILTQPEQQPQEQFDHSPTIEERIYLREEDFESLHSSQQQSSHSSVSYKDSTSFRLDVSKQLQQNSKSASTEVIQSTLRHRDTPPIKVSPSSSTEGLENVNKAVHKESSLQKPSEDLIVRRTNRQISDQNSCKLQEASKGIIDSRCQGHQQTHTDEWSVDGNRGDEEEKLSESVEWWNHNNTNNHTDEQKDEEMEQRENTIDQHEEEKEKDYVQQQQQEQQQQVILQQSQLQQQQQCQQQSQIQSQSQKIYLKFSADKSDLNYSSDNLTESFLPESNHFNNDDTTQNHPSSNLDVYIAAEDHHSQQDDNNDINNNQDSSVHRLKKEEKEEEEDVEVLADNNLIDSLKATSNQQGQFIKISSIISSSLNPAILLVEGAQENHNALFSQNDKSDSNNKAENNSTVQEGDDSRIGQEHQMKQEEKEDASQAIKETLEDLQMAITIKIAATDDDEEQEEHGCDNNRIATTQINQDDSKKNKESQQNNYVSSQQPAGEQHDHPSTVIPAAAAATARKPSGFKTGIQSVKDYLALVINHIKGDAAYKLKFIAHINTWLGPQPEELLKLLHMYEDSQLEISEEEDDDSSYLTQPILDGKLYADIEKSRQAGLQPPADTREQQMRTLERIHNKAVFEAFNEALDSERMYGLHGKPFPWKVTATRLSVKPREDEAIPSILQHASDQVVMWSQSLCGILVDKPESYFLPGVKIDEEQLRQIKEDRLTRLLSQEVIENEEKWLEYDEEETEVQVELSQMVFENLIFEVQEEFTKIAFKHSLLFQ